MGYSDLLVPWLVAQNTAQSTAISALSAQINDAWQIWEPTLVWGTATPDGVTTLARYKTIGKTVFFTVLIVCTDSNATTSLSVSLHIVPKNQSIYPAVTGTRATSASSTSLTAITAFIRDDGTNNDLRGVLSTTDGTGYAFRYTGFYEIA